VAVDWRPDDLSPHEWSAAMQRLEILPIFRDILSVVGFWTTASSQAYIACGSFYPFSL